MAPDASTSPVEWGPEIRVNNCKPDGLATDWTPVWWTDGEVQHVSSTDRLVWEQERVPLKAIRLPTGHPYYSKTPTTPELDPALWDRMVALVREMALRDNGDGTVSLFKIREHVDAAMSIVADLPKPVDPDERYAADLIRAQGWQGEGPIGEAAVLSMIAKAHRDGRELASPEVPHVG